VLISQINWVAALASVVAATVVGTLWYGPLFGKAWMAELGRTPEQMKDGQVVAMASAFIANFIAAAVLSVIEVRLGAQSLGGAMGVGVIVWLAFVAGQQFMQDRFHLRSVKLSLINAGNTLLSFLAMAAVIHLLK
jgi:Protein of unknown function (DUF1761)